MTPDLRFRVLGPLEVLCGDETCTPSAPKQRALLALLLLHANELVPRHTIVDELWGCRPPRSAVAALQMHVSAARRALVPSDAAPLADPRRHPVVQTEPSGYILRVASNQLDLSQFRTLAQKGRAALARDQCDTAGDLFRSALSLWRGPALADVGRTGGLERYATRLEEERLGLVQMRITVDLCQGGGLEVVGELEELCVRHPLRETLYEQLMWAMCLTGRRAEALRVYRRAYRIITDQAGVEPGPELQAAQRTVLSGSVPPHLRRHPPSGRPDHEAGQPDWTFGKALACHWNDFGASGQDRPRAEVGKEV